MPDELRKVVIHTDGGCHGNPGPGGWAAILAYGDRQKEVSGGCPATTNNRMELQAAISGLLALKKPCCVELFTDSEYLRSGITEWVGAWKRRGWVTKGRRPVRNQDLWMELDRLAALHSVEWRWLKGHAGHPLNERCDLLTQSEIAKIRKTVPAAELKRLLAEFQKNRHIPAKPNATSRAEAPLSLF